jgi:hypothetical protein
VNSANRHFRDRALARDIGYVLLAKLLILVLLKLTFFNDPVAVDGDRIAEQIYTGRVAR